MENLTWYEAKKAGNVPRERFGAASCCVGTSLVIFGGLNNDNFCNGNVYVFEMDPFNAKRQS